VHFGRESTPFQRSQHTKGFVPDAEQNYVLTRTSILSSTVKAIRHCEISQCFIVTPSLPSKAEKREIRAWNIRTLKQLHRSDWSDSLVSSLKQIISCHNVF